MTEYAKAIDRQAMPKNLLAQGCGCVSECGCARKCGCAIGSKTESAEAETAAAKSEMQEIPQIGRASTTTPAEAEAAAAAAAAEAEETKPTRLWGTIIWAKNHLLAPRMRLPNSTKVEDTESK